MEKEGSLSNSGRWAQWRYKAQNPPGDAKPDGDIMVELFNHIRALYKDKKGKGVYPDAILNLKWDYLKDGKYDVHAVAKIINGTYTKDLTVQDKSFKKGDQVAGFAALLPMARPQVATGCTARATMPTATTWRGASKRTPAVSGSTPSGLVLAGESPDHIQPRLRGPAGQTLESQAGGGGVRR